MSTDHDHEHDHPEFVHPGLESRSLSQRAADLQAILVEKGYVDPAAVERYASVYESEVGPMIGAAIVARAWTDPAYRSRLLADGTAAAAEMGAEGRQGEHLIAVECTPDQHHMVVCTLCSCYPWTVLGLPPDWYKSAPYRAKAVRDPRGVLTDFGVDFPADKPIRVWDSSAEVRYLVIPERPAGTQGWTPEQLSVLVTRDAMIGSGLAIQP